MILMNVDGDKLNAGMRATADAIRASTGSSDPITWDYEGGTGFASSITGVSASIKMIELTLASNWAAGNPHTLRVTIPEADSESKIDLQADSTVINQMIADGTQALYITNDDGVFTAYAIGEAPTVSLTVQCTITNVNIAQDSEQEG